MWKLSKASLKQFQDSQKKANLGTNTEIFLFMTLVLMAVLPFGKSMPMI
jgi:hypothetical protein